MRIRIFRLRIAFAAVFLLLALNSVFAADSTVTRRLGIFIGSNNGGMDRITLRYAVSDARSVSRVFTGMGGITAEDSILLIEPTMAEINRQLDNLGRISAQSHRNAQRTELVFYYSGHSDEDGILLNKERYGYKELRDRINTVQADMSIVILDSCSSGAITRAKGGVKTQPFLFDSSVSAEGYAFLTSSSADETSQESDAYDIQIYGSGDVVLTDIKEISASLLISEEVTGRISIRDSSDFLVAELTKVANKPLELGLEPGLYRIVLQQGDKFYRAEITLLENTRTRLGMDTFSGVAATSGNRRRGGDSEEMDGDITNFSFSFQIVPGVEYNGYNSEKATYNLLLGLFVARGHNLLGLGAASIGLINTGYALGIQASFIFNIADGQVTGVQTAGAFNIARSGVGNGIQYSGIFNYAGGNVTGMQVSSFFNKAEELRGMQIGTVNVNSGGTGLMIGLVNVSGSDKVVPIGLVNIIKDGIMHPYAYFDDMMFSNIGFRSGSKHFYSTIGIGLGGSIFFGRGDKLLVTRGGFGFEFPFKKLFFDIEVSGGRIIKLDYVWDDTDELPTTMTQLRLVAGYKLFPHFGVFAGVSYDYFHRMRETSPDPRDFGGPFIGFGNDKHIGKLGFFGGIQF
jgi:hypothetical protein